MKTRWLVLMSLLAAPAVGQAQTTEQLLVKAESLYNASSIEASRNLAQTVLSSKGQVSTEQRVRAYKFIGASYAVLSKLDSATSYFVPALDNDPFTDLDTKTFGPDEQAAFAAARALIFKVGVKEVNQQVLDLRSSRTDSSTYLFQLATTHAARTKVEIFPRANPTNIEVLYDANNSGTRDIPWKGLILAQRADTGIYEFRVTATDPNPKGGGVDKQSVLFRVEQVHIPFEDSLPPLTANDTLVSRNGALAPVWGLSRGLFVAAAAVGLPAALRLSGGQVPGWGRHAAFGVGLGITSGAIAALISAKNPTNSVAAGENARRKRQHDAFNAAVAARNQDRASKTILIIRPLTGGAGTGG